jgi:hypothetical protein
MKGADPWLAEDLFEVAQFNFIKEQKDLPQTEDE